jgi:folylpolyglutamate synthase/dihydropteroate synthase
MIEAVNSVVANASVLRGQAEAVSTVRSLTANPERVQEIAQAPYVSPFIYVDVAHNKAVLQIRDSDTGDVLKQFPSDTTLEIRARIAKQSAPDFHVPEPPPEETHTDTAPQTFTAPTPAPAPQNAQAQVAAAALASTQAQAAAVSAPPTSGNVVVTA